MRTIAFEQKQQRKIRAALVRLKYSLKADQELFDMENAVQDALKKGEVLKLDTTLEEILNHEAS